MFSQEKIFTPDDAETGFAPDVDSESTVETKSISQVFKQLKILTADYPKHKLSCSRKNHKRYEKLHFDHTHEDVFFKV